MKIYREYQSGGNVGDDLNEWLWPKLFPGMFDTPEGGHLAGIGTILDGSGRLPSAEPFVVFGTGVRYRVPVPTVQPNWDIRFVRGPMSCIALGLSTDYAITDAASCIRLTDYDFTPRKRYACSYVPHYRSIQPIGLRVWKMICRMSGLHLINPQDGVDHVLKEIAMSERVIAEAMHGAILADTFRVPWIRVRISYDEHHQPVESDFKWLDWATSIGVVAQPLAFPALRPNRSSWGMIDRVWDPPRIAHIIARLKTAIRSDRFQLSADQKINELDERLAEQVDRLRKDTASLDGVHVA